MNTYEGQLPLILNTLINRAQTVGFPGKLRSIDCYEWGCKNCPAAYQGQYQGKEGVSTITLQSISDDRLYKCPPCFSVPECTNHTNVFEASALCNKIANGSHPLALQCNIGRKRHRQSYWLADDLYSAYPIFAHSCKNPVTPNEKLFAQKQDGRRKDVYRAFDVLQSKFQIISRLSQLLFTKDMSVIMQTCSSLQSLMADDQETWQEGLESKR